MLTGGGGGGGPAVLRLEDRLDRSELEGFSSSCLLLLLEELLLGLLLA